MLGGNVTATDDVNTDLDRTRFFIDGEWVEPRGTETHCPRGRGRGRILRQRPEPRNPLDPAVTCGPMASEQLAREEVFGPVMAIIPFDDDDDAVAIANDSNYGLGGSVWTTNDEGQRHRP
jgi:acyl-CoA reductase-like NAD-dependent aldehyde dehydrogenase